MVYKALIEQYGILTGNGILNHPPENRADILALAARGEHPLLVDPVAARYVFDYQLPPGAIDFDFAAPFPGFVPTDTKLRTNDIFVIGPGKVLLLNDDIHASYPLEYWSPFGFKGRSFNKHPTQAFVIPARDCSALQEKNLSQKN